MEVETVWCLALPGEKVDLTAVEESRPLADYAGYGPCPL